MLYDLNDRVGNEEILNEMGKYALHLKVVSEERLLEMWSGKEMVTSNTKFRKK